MRQRRDVWHDVGVYATLYTRRGTPQHDRMISAYLDEGQYVVLSGEMYAITNVDWIPLAEAFRWEVRRVHVTANA